MKIQRLLLPCFSTLALLGIATQALAIEELDLLEEFGIEVFQTDPARQVKEDAKEERERKEALPPYILPETLDADAALDAVDLESPKEPIWTPIEHETSLTAVDSKECCLRAIRSTRYEVETQCREKGHQVWQIESIPVQGAEADVVKTHRLCSVYYNEQTKQQLQDALEQQTEKGDTAEDIVPDYYKCSARSQAKCFDPTGENAIFGRISD